VDQVQDGSLSDASLEFDIAAWKVWVPTLNVLYTMPMMMAVLLGDENVKVSTAHIPMLSKLSLMHKLDFNTVQWAAL
jgi:hypothetical protein